MHYKKFCYTDCILHYYLWCLLLKAYIHLLLIRYFQKIQSNDLQLKLGFQSLEAC